MPSRENRAETKAVERRKLSNQVSLGGSIAVYGEDLAQYCLNMAPDGELRCGEAALHLGVHRNGEATWYGSQWFT